ncbi:MAG TPA: GNAT family N-acetyltransferase [Acidimicrobiia bacterium]|nr:GNAT family N-acetyltransferase [Acidimicrobiia bacterium]
MRVRRARPEEFEVVLAVLADAAGWLRAQDVEQWPDRFPADWVMPAIQRGETWLAEHESGVMGTMVVQWEDPTFWFGYPDDAGYLHRLAVVAHGIGLGSRLLAWAERHAARHGKTFLRLDCVASNAALRAYYERAGYSAVGDVTVGEYTQTRFEKPVGG